MGPAFAIRTTICGLEELDRHSDRGVTHILSLLDPNSPEPEIFGTYQPHRRTTLRFHDEIDPGPNLVLPQAEHVEKILAFGRSLAAQAGNGGERHILVHCHMGISRSTAATAAILAAIHPVESEDAIFSELLRQRPEAWPNCLMIAFADDLLARNGRLVTALGGLYAAQLVRRPDLGPYLRKHGRGREVDMAAAPSLGRSGSDVRL